MNIEATQRTDPDAELWFETALLPEGWATAVRVSVHAGAIVHIEAGALPAQAERHALAVPGLPNLHSHAFQRAFAGLTERRAGAVDSFWSWRTLMYRFLERLHPPELEAIATLAFAEMLEAGFTRVGEFHYLHHAPDGQRYDDLAELSARIAAAAEQAGIGLTLLPVFYAHGGFGGRAPEPAQRRFVCGLEEFARLLEGARRAVAPLFGANVGVAPHSLRAVAPAELAALVTLIPGAPIHLHVAEQTAEVEDCLAWSGARPVEWLLANAPVDRHWCLVHATHVNAAEIAQLAASSAVAGLCPITEANLGDGIFPAVAYLTAGGRFGIGSDSNVCIDAAEELRLLEYGQRLTHRARNLLTPDAQRSTGRQLFEFALAGGAQALGVAPHGLAVGAPADIVSLDRNHPALAARSGDALLDSWIFAAGRGAIDCVWSRGRKCVEHGRHLERPTITRAYTAALTRLLA